MTLFKQIALMLSTLLIIILVTVLVLNFNSANESVKERLYNDSKNTATSLSLSLATAQGDTTVMSTMINASFDSGYYRYIYLHDVDDNVIYHRIVEEKVIDVPDWFLNAITITAPIASANVSAGWSQVGILYVQGDTDYAYMQLYTIFKNLMISLSIIVIFGLTVLNLVLAIILRPMQRVQVQAEALTRNEFIIQEDIPYTKEFKDVVLGMNTMVKKVKAMFDKGNEELKRQKELEYIDQDTKLRNRKYFVDKLPEFLKIDASSKGGVNIMVALSGVAEANENIGHKRVDELLIEIAEIFKLNISRFPSSIVARMNGTEFSLFMPDCTEESAIYIAKKIKKDVKELISNSGLDNEETYISLGMYGYNHKERIAQFLSHSDDALAKAKFSNDKLFFEFSKDIIEVMGKDAWREIIDQAIATNSFSFIPYKVVETKFKEVMHNALSLSLKVDDNTTYNYGQFMAPANQAGLSHKIYDNVLSMMFKRNDNNLNGSVSSLRLPYDYLESEDSYEYMNKLFTEYANKLNFKLIIEIPDKFAYKHSEQAKLYKNLFERHSIELGLYEFIGEGGDYQYLQDIRPVYIKGEASYFISQKDQTLSAFRLITDTVGISLIASGVMELDSVEKLKEKDIYIVQGRASELL